MGGSVAMFRCSWKLSLAVWPLLVLGALHGARAGGQRSAVAAESLARCRREALAFAEERLQHSDLVRWFCRREKEAKAFEEKCHECVLVAKKAAQSRGIAHLVLDWSSKGVLLGLSSLGSRLVARGELTAGQLTSYFFHAAFLGLGLYGFVGLVPEIAAAQAAARRLYAMKSVEHKEEDTPKRSLPYLPVSFEDVHFRPWRRLHITKEFICMLHA